MPGVSISWKKTNIGKKSKNKSNKNTKVKEQKISLTKLVYINKSETSAFVKKQVFNTRAQKSNSTFYQRKNIKKNDTKIKRKVIKTCKSNIEKNDLLFVPIPQDSIKKQVKKAISPKDKTGIFFATTSMLYALTSPLMSLVFANIAGFFLYLIELTFDLYAITSSVFIFTAILNGAIAFSIFKNAKQDKDIKNYREFQKQRKTWLILCLSMILLSIPLNYFLITAVFL